MLLPPLLFGIALVHLLLAASPAGILEFVVGIAAFQLEVRPLPLGFVAV